MLHYNATYWRKIRKHVLSKGVKGNHQRPWVPSKFVQGNSTELNAGETNVKKPAISWYFWDSLNQWIMWSSCLSFFMRWNYAFQFPIKLTESLVLFSTSTRIHALFVSANIYEICKQRKRKESGDFRTCRLRLHYLTWRRVDRIAIITNHLIGPTLCLFRTCFL